MKNVCNMIKIVFDVLQCEICFQNTFNKKKLDTLFSQVYYEMLLKNQFIYTSEESLIQYLSDGYICQ